MDGGRHLGVTLAIACALHVAAFTAVRARSSSSALSRGVPVDTSEQATFEVEQEVPVPNAAIAPEPEGARAAQTDAPRRPGVVARADRPGPATADPGAQADAPVGTPEPVVTAPDGQGWSFQPSRIDLGIDPKRRALLATGPSPAEAPSSANAASASRTGGLAESLDAHDVALGLGRGGAINTVIHDAVQTSSVMGKAIFAITIDGAGKVTVGVSSATQDEIGWAGLSEAIRASVAAKKDHIRIAPGSAGLRIAVEAEAHEQYPNGTKPKDLGTRAVAKGTDLGIEHHGKVCSVALKLSLTPISGGCDPSNIGTVASRIVTSHIVSESRL